jgi:hypothetical protein
MTRMSKCSIHSTYCNYIKENNLINQSFNFLNFVNNYQLSVTQMKLKIIGNLKSGDFHWFRPVQDTNLTRVMVDMNMELQIIMDNPNYRREDVVKLNDKMYKIFTFQNEKIKHKQYNAISSEYPVSTAEGFDNNGDYFIDYNFNTKTEDDSVYPDCFVKANVNQMHCMDSKIIDKELNEIIFELKESFHIMLYSLDIEKFTASELKEDIYQELKSLSFKIEKEDIIILDEQAIISKI